MRLSPIALFVYNRLEHLQQTVESLKENSLAKESELFVFSDAAKDKKTEGAVKDVRDYLKTLGGFKRVIVNEFEANLGPSKAIIKGVTDLVNRYGRVIVLEDDLLLSPYFLKYMNDALLFYEKNDKVISVCGYMYPVKTKDQETVFLKMPDSWGWGTWKRGWDLFDPDAGSLLKQIESKKMIRRFNLNGGYDFYKMLKKQAGNKISSWAVCWYASSLLNDKLSLYPAKSLVRNIGFDDSGTHCNCPSGYNTDILQKHVDILEMPAEEDRDAAKKVEMFFRINEFKKMAYAAHKLLRWVQGRPMR